MLLFLLFFPWPYEQQTTSMLFNVVDNRPGFITIQLKSALKSEPGELDITLRAEGTSPSVVSKTVEIAETFLNKDVEVTVEKSDQEKGTSESLSYFLPQYFLQSHCPHNILLLPGSITMQCTSSKIEKDFESWRNQLDSESLWLEHKPSDIKAGALSFAVKYQNGDVRWYCGSSDNYFRSAGFVSDKYCKLLEALQSNGVHLFPKTERLEHKFIEAEYKNIIDIAPSLRSSMGGLAIYFGYMDDKYNVHEDWLNLCDRDYVIAKNGDVFRFRFKSKETRSDLCKNLLALGENDVTYPLTMKQVSSNSISVISHQNGEHVDPSGSDKKEGVILEGTETDDEVKVPVPVSKALIIGIVVSSVFLLGLVIAVLVILFFKKKRNA